MMNEFQTEGLRTRTRPASPFPAGGGPSFGTMPVWYGNRLVIVVACFPDAEAAARCGAPLLAARSGMERAAVRAIPLYPVQVKTSRGNLWGYIDERGRVVLAPQYEYALDFQNNGLAIVQTHDKQGVIDASGRFVIQPVYESISPFSEGRSAAIDSQGFRVIDERGRVLTPGAYSYIGSYREGRAVFAKSGHEGESRYGYLDRDGKEVIPDRFVEAGDFSGGRALVKLGDNRYALIDPNGRQLAAFSYAYVGPPGEGLLAFQQEANGKNGYIDEKGNVVIPPRFTAALPFQDGRAVVNTAEDYHNRYGLIDRKGSFVIQPVYNEINPLGEKRLAVGKAIDPQQPFIGSTYALADTDGRLLTDFRFRSIGEFHQGYAPVSDRTSTYWIDTNGRAAANLPKAAGSGTMAFIGKLVSANIDQRLSYYDRTGRLVWQPSPVIPLKPPFAVREVKFKPNPDYLVYYPQVEGMADPNAERKVNLRLKQLSAVKPVPAHEQLEASYTGDFAVAFYRNHLLVLQLDGYNFPFGAAHGMPSREYVHVNLLNGDMYALKDLFKAGSPYVNRISDIIRKRIATDPAYSYVFPGSFKQIAPDQLFYVTGDALHIVFPPYEIAPYAAGFPTFTIPYAELADIIDTSGAFWKSFH
ncbi:WG repeat-containing protein [Paenibacillus hodogayensis]|uniref:WG repeat-containing protein n=1 Tax=Paenibacillus hodogayensis TaxID=279208 RepID=A0ABV5VZN3_9BACL